MSKRIGAFIMGGLFGIAAGMILMPQLEPGTREKIKEKGKEMIEEAAQMIPDNMMK